MWHQHKTIDGMIDSDKLYQSVNHCVAVIHPELIRRSYGPRRRTRFWHAIEVAGRTRMSTGRIPHECNQEFTPGSL